MLRKVNAIAVAAVMAAGTGGALRAQAATAVAVPCSATALASAVASAVSGTTLSLAASCVYTLTAALPEVSQDLTITGNRATLQRSYAAGTAAFTILTVAGSGILAVSELNFRHGDGAIAAVDDGQLTVNGGTFTGNAATDGGAIDSNVGRYAPQITDATFVRNLATGDGGAIYDNSSASSMGVRGSVFTGNMAADGGGAIWDYGEEGGIAASTFWGNTAGAGGALWVDENYPEIITNVVVSRNSASGDGGGIYGTVSLDNSTVSGNYAGDQGGGLYDGFVDESFVSGSHIEGNSAADGAGIYNDIGVPFQLTASTVSGNHATADGGGIYNANDAGETLATSTVSGNYAEGHGGGIYSLGGDSFLTASGTRIIRNRAQGGGGGIYDGPDTTVTLTSSPVTGNQPDNCEPPGSITGCTS
jgi:predicted outer membrane repeat protein